MPRTTGKAEYKRLKGKLLASDSRDFERLSLPLIRLITPITFGTPALGESDKIGVDLLAWSGGKAFELVVQCKGFKVGERELDKTQVAQCVKSIKSFKESHQEAKTYLLVYNRFGEQAKFRMDVEAALGELTASGRVQCAELWDINRLMNEAANAIRHRVLHHIRSSITEGSTDGALELTQVPFTETACVVDRQKVSPPMSERSLLADPVDQILSVGEGLDARVVLLGEAGYGKTTAALRAARSTKKRMFFVRAAAIVRGGQSKNELLEQFNFVSDLICDIRPEDVPTVEPLVRSAVESVFSIPRVPALLIIDGLDESAALSRRGGLQWLFNCINSFEIPVLLTARTEFWRSRLTDFGTAIGMPSPKPSSPQRDTRLRILELRPWGNPQIAYVAERFRNGHVDMTERAHIEHFIELVQRDDYAKLYGDIPRRPLFLKLILETVAKTGLHSLGRIDLVEEWAREKIIRDYAEPARIGGERISILTEGEVVDVTIDLAFRAMRRAAKLMSQVTKGFLELLPSCQVYQVLDAEPSLRSITDALGLFLNSLLVPLSGAGTSTVIRFGHQVYQEFFLAKYIEMHRDEFVDVEISDDVKQWMRT